jgi:polyisoprenoid-binding protein YceI
MKAAPVKLVPVGLLLASALFAAPEPSEVTLELNPAQSQVTFTLSDFLHTIHGTFQLTRGTIRLDAVTGRASGEIVVDAASGRSGIRARDRRMRRNVLESSKYPSITFKPDRVVGALNPGGVSQVEIHGLFGIHGGEHEMTVPAKVDFSNSQMSATLNFSVPYVQWGMKDPGLLFLRVNDTVDIELRAAGRKSTATASLR